MNVSFQTLTRANLKCIVKHKPTNERVCRIMNNISDEKIRNEWKEAYRNVEKGEKKYE